jgi:hypothetical protein
MKDPLVFIAAVATGSFPAAAQLVIPDLTGMLYYAAFAASAGGCLSLLYYTPDQPHARRRLLAGILLAAVVGSAAGGVWAERSAHAYEALGVAVGSACTTSYAVSGRDVFGMADKILALLARINPWSK